MLDDDATQIEKIASREMDLVRVYGEIFPVLKGADLTNLTDDAVSDLENLNDPSNIEPSKAIAILKSIRGSTPEDKFQFERLYPLAMGSGKCLGEYVGDQFTELGVSYHDFWPYLRARGWLNE
jgi:hypothetical protein